MGRLSNARKIRNNNLEIKKKNLKLVPKLEDSLILNSLPKGTKPPNSSPSKKGHSVVLDRKLFSTSTITLHHLPSITNIRILQSVPSPGIGH
ncbi:hypothetical protein BVC80_1793g20 [Macleaya cordata]|uniref:Uncharacterized protein n=1 Tax=Macleaya cordata TaxID=56857 RepID=A0A200QPN2_MACCD|nr:hypothetical protein BVC80_1793g20 [Macleaya cordata]